MRVSTAFPYLLVLFDLNNREQCYIKRRNQDAALFDKSLFPTGSILRTSEILHDER